MHAASPSLIAPLSYVTLLDARPLDAIDTVIIHCTELPDLAAARACGEQVRYGSGTGNSGHWYIDRDGHNERWVPPERVAHHTRGWNARSVGIELVNRGRWPHWLHAHHQAMEQPYPHAQIQALILLLEKLRTDLPALRFIAGHEDLDTGVVPAEDEPTILVARKRDPGPLFPWSEITPQIPLQRLR